MKLKLIAAAVVFAAATSAMAGTIDLTFDGIAPYPNSNDVAIQGYYGGGTSSVGSSGTNYGITFSDNALVLCLNSLTTLCSNTSRGGVGDPASQQGALYWLNDSDTYLNDPAGFTTGFSFNYSDPFIAGAYVNVYSGLDGTGTLLGTISLPLTPDGQAGACPGYDANYCPFLPAGVSFAGTAESIDFGGSADFVIYDDVTFGSSNPGPVPSTVPEPSSLMLLGTGLVSIFGAIRRKINA